MSVPNEKHKDSVFTDLFQNNPENFLSLYNAIHDTHLRLEDVTLEPERIENTLVRTYYNDVSMLMNGKLIVLLEHQSTINENMPLRLLDYVTRIYERIVPNEKRYQKNLSFIPTPEFYVFYNGLEPYPDEKELKLSSAYFHSVENPPLELKVTVFNIGNPTTEKCLNILNKCDILKQYCECIEVIRKTYRKGFPETYDRAIKECISKGILGTYLTENYKENRNMLIHDYDYDTDIRVQRQESFEAGEKQGEKNGEKKKAIEDAKALLGSGKLALEEISMYINLPLEEVQKLAEEVKNNA